MLPAVRSATYAEFIYNPWRLLRHCTRDMTSLEFVDRGVE